MAKTTNGKSGKASKEALPVLEKKNNSLDILATVLKNELEKQFKGENVSYYLDGSEDTPADVLDWISTGSTLLDVAISNRIDGGLPTGRIVEYTGLEGSGKSLAAAHAIANTQKKGGIGILIDTENSISKEYLTAVGVDLNKMLYVQLDTVEDIFDAIEKVILKVRTEYPTKLVTIVIDSLSAASSKVEMEAGYEKEGYGTAKAALISLAMRKLTLVIAKYRILLIITNQLRFKVGQMVGFGGDPYTTSGGKAVAFHSSVRVRFKQVGKIKGDVNGIERIIGVNSIGEVIKSRVGPPHGKAEFNIYFASGIDDYGGWFDTLKKHKIITGGAAGKYELIDESTGEVIDIKSTTFTQNMRDNEVTRNKIKAILCNKFIMPYSNINTFDLDAVKVAAPEDDVADES